MKFAEQYMIPLKHNKVEKSYGRLHKVTPEDPGECYFQET